MKNFRHLLSTVLLCSLLVVYCALAQNTLTQIRDIVHKADGTPFNGTVIITWNGFTAPSGGTIAPHSTSAQIYNGALSILLVPSTTASTGAYYLATYNSNDGLTTFTETWQVPPSSTPLTLSQVRQPAGTGTGSTGGSGSGGTGGTSGSGTGSTITLPLPITQVSGLSAALATINSSIDTLSTAVKNIPTTSVTGVAFVDAEIPSGAINGTNGVFSLSQAPSPASSLQLYLNGLELTAGLDFTMTANTVAFASNAIPQAGDELTAYYRIPGTGTTAQFTDGETPSGTIGGTNVAFTLAAAPSPAASLRLYKNGMLLQQGADYTLNNTTITFSSAVTAPQTGDVLTAGYRH
ncbi:MAG TPA: hypothetical protein VLJ11_01055 [Bryobacteraceae bacterium]|nr:hypothetical protein [Bryobacteraceae bacterium]